MFNISVHSCVYSSDLSACSVNATTIDTKNSFEMTYNKLELLFDAFVERRQFQGPAYFDISKETRAALRLSVVFTGLVSFVCLCSRDG